MPVEVIVLALGTLLGIGGIILAGQRMQYRHKERLVSQTDPDAVKQLREVVQDLCCETAQGGRPGPAGGSAEPAGFILRLRRTPGIHGAPVVEAEDRRTQRRLTGDQGAL